MARTDAERVRKETTKQEKGCIKAIVTLPFTIIEELFKGAKKRSDKKLREKKQRTKKLRRQ